MLKQLVAAGVITRDQLTTARDDLFNETQSAQ
jgi:hypothetical protein